MVQLVDQWAGTRWATEPHIRFGDPCYDCAVPMTPASRWWSALTIPAGMRKHAGSGLCSTCANRRRREAQSESEAFDREVERRLVALSRSQTSGRPCESHGEEGGLSPRLAIVIAGVGLFVWGWSHGSRTPDGRWLAAVAIVAVTVLVLFTFGHRDRRRERLDAAYTKRMEAGLQQDRSGDHYWDA